MASRHQPESAAFEVLRQYLSARAGFRTDDLDAVRAAFLSRRLRVGDYLQRAGDVTKKPREASSQWPLAERCVRGPSKESVERYCKKIIRRPTSL